MRFLRLVRRNGIKERRTCFAYTHVRLFLFLRFNSGLCNLFEHVIYSIKVA